MSRLHHIDDINSIQASFELTDCEAKIIQKYVIEKNYSHDELLKVVDPKICLDC